jgi:O-acetyl-ADP-ribose deacetylase (regulator of RNase III)
MGGYRDEHSLLAACYQNCLKLAKENKVRTIAFPGISTGVYGFPADQAALVAVNEIRRFLKHNDLPEKVIFVAFNDCGYDVYRKLLYQ